MTTLAIVANHEKKRLSLTGTVAAGEHVAVTLEDGWAWANAAGAALRLRIVFAGKLIAEFPRRDADPADTWSASGDDATCELNINSVPAAKHLKFGGDCIWVLDDPQLNTLYGVGELEVLPWRREPGGDVPYNLDGYPDLLDEFEEVKDAVSEFDTKKINKSAFISLLGKTLPETATQKEVREMVHDILELLKNAAVCAALAFALPAFGIDANTAWEDIPPQVKVKNVVEQFSPPADFSTNNAALVETIEAKVPEIQVDFSTNNAALVETIEATAPAPGNYAAVSNAAMSAVTHEELTNSTSSLRGKTDLSVYKRVGVGETWTLVATQSGYKGKTTTVTGVFSDGGDPTTRNWAFYVGDENVAGSATRVDADSCEVQWVGGEEVGYAGIARRPFVYQPVTDDSLAKLSEVVSSTGGVFKAGAKLFFMENDETPGSGVVISEEGIRLVDDSIIISSDENSIEIESTDVVIHESCLVFNHEDGPDYLMRDIRESLDAATATNAAQSAALAEVPHIVTNIVRDISLGGIWDEELQVWWTPVMRSGSLTYQATTNVNLNAEN